MASLEAVWITGEAIRNEIAKAVVGQEDVIEHLLIGLLSGGHVLLEGVPGTAKTLMVKALALSVGCEFKRVQMTPDLMPSDILGVSIYDRAADRFTLRKGP
ncbi:MAG TPA: AAA family ATPase, partial [Armatimonadota bacterium]|nr:AAA family ATPase [Armatimonadota bacterium]